MIDWRSVRVRENIITRNGEVVFTAGVVYHVISKGDYSVIVKDNRGELSALYNSEFEVTV
mgnify:CR=1 FL=1